MISSSDPSRSLLFSIKTINEYLILELRTFIIFIDKRELSKFSSTLANLIKIQKVVVK